MKELILYIATLFQGLIIKVAWESCFGSFSIPFKSIIVERFLQNVAIAIAMCSDHIMVSLFYYCK